MKPVQIPDLILGQRYYTEEEGTREIRLVRRTPDWLYVQLLKGKMSMASDSNDLYVLHNLPVIGRFYQTKEQAAEKVKTTPLKLTRTKKLKLTRTKKLKLTRTKK